MASTVFSRLLLHPHHLHQSLSPAAISTTGPHSLCHLLLPSPVPTTSIRFLRPSPTPISSLPYLFQPWRSLSPLAYCCYLLLILHTPISLHHPVSSSHMTNTYRACLSPPLFPHQLYCSSPHSPVSPTYARFHHFLCIPTTSPQPLVYLMCPLALHDHHRPSVPNSSAPSLQVTFPAFHTISHSTRVMAASFRDIVPFKN